MNLMELTKDPLFGMFLTLITFVLFIVCPRKENPKIYVNSIKIFIFVPLYFQVNCLILL